MKRLISVIIAMFAFSSLVLMRSQTFEEQLYQLSLLRERYSSIQDIDNTISTHRRIIAIIEERDKNNGISIYRDNDYFEEQKDLFNNLYLAQKYPESIIQLRVILDLLEKRGEGKSETYLKYLFYLILAYHTLGEYNNEALLFDTYENLARALKITDAEDYIEYLMLKAEASTFLSRTDDFNEASVHCRALLEKFYIPNSRPFLMYEAMEANQLVSLGRFDEAQEHVNSCYAIMESDVFSFNDKSDRFLITSHIYLMEGQINASRNPLKAEQLFKRAIDGLSQIGADLFAPINELGCLYLFVFRDFKKAIDSFKNAKKDLEHHGREQSMQYITIQNNLAVSYQYLGLSSEAIAAFDEAEETVKQHYGKTHPMYGTIAQNKSKFYGELSDYDTAIEYAKEAATCMKSIYGENSEKYATCLCNLSVFYGIMGRIDESKELLLRAIPILEKNSIPNAVASYSLLLSHYSYNKNWNDFYDLVNKCMLLIKYNKLQGTDIEAMFLTEVGSALKDKDKSGAQMYFAKAVQVHENLGIISSTKYFRTLLEYYRALITANSHNNQIIPNLTDAYKKLYFSNVIFYNAAEREQFVTSSTYSIIKDIIFTARSGKSQDILLYDYLLFSKGLLLETSINYAKAILDSNNDELIEQFSLLVDLKRTLNGEKGNKNNVPLIELQKEATRLERRITSFLKETGGYTDGLNYTFFDVAKALKKSEAAIEFVSYHDYFEDADYYAALIVKKNRDTPEFVRLCKKNELEKFFSLSPAVLYGESIASEGAYSLIWKPIMPFLSDIKTIFFSPAGYLNRLAIDQLYNGEKRFNELFRAYRVTSTRQICSPIPQMKFSSAVLYGGLNYDEDDMTMVIESKNIRGEKSSHNLVFRGWNGAKTRKGWEFLPGTLVEVNQISSIITNKRIKCDVYTAGKGNEESFKALSGGNFNILHLATHGFYMTESQAEKNRFYTSNPWTNTYFSNEVSPLKRSGLLLAGGNKAWKGEPVPDGVEDGVLTAEEISSLDLRSCDVVVLSACETGLGEITDEGVYGLQRAFKMAGVETIIMSLWEVDDKATSLFMSFFYEALTAGKNKHEAFVSAQNQLREKYSDPYYWAAFIMLD